MDDIIHFCSIGVRLDVRKYNSSQKLSVISHTNSQFLHFIFIFDIENSVDSRTLNKRVIRGTVGTYICYGIYVFSETFDSHEEGFWIGRICCEELCQKFFIFF